ncbi:hypothetical protein [uncultured Draconibacterium sp.]|uniref:hypothetical protein n=1 Tax=uncultured Draconibacterium sp. TaxID=1573823 RepID=UPI003216A66A
MKRSGLIFILVLLVHVVFAQENPLSRFENLIGKWQGTGEGFSSSASTIEADYSWILNKQFIQLKHRSEFKPTAKNPKGEIHEDLGIISFDSERKVIVFRQYHGEGFFNEYLLNDSISNESSLIFETERIENFVPGGKARFTINIKSDSEIETLFDVGFPGKEMACFGKNSLKKQ